MTTAFTIIQCVPDPIADERMNIGVVVYGDGRIRSRFITDWRSVSSFARDDISYLRNFARRFSQATQASTSVPQQIALVDDAHSQPLTEETLVNMINAWSNSIQFSPPQVSLEHPDALLEKLSAVYLRDPSSHQGYRDRESAVHLAVTSVRKAVERRLGATTAKEVVRSPYEIAGRLVPRLKLDLAVTNGRVYVATQALSFETLNLQTLDAQIQTTLHRLKDIGDAHPTLRLASVVLPPNSKLDGYHEVHQRFAEFRTLTTRAKIRVVEEDDAPDWAEEIANLVEMEIAPHLRRSLFT